MKYLEVKWAHEIFAEIFEIFGGKVRIPSWGVLHPEQSLTRPATLEETDPDLHRSLASLEARCLASSLEENLSRTSAGWRCDCKVGGSMLFHRSVIYLKLLNHSETEYNRKLLCSTFYNRTAKAK